MTQFHGMTLATKRKYREQLLADAELLRKEIGEDEAPTGYQCPECGRQMSAAQRKAGTCPSCGASTSTEPAPTAKSAPTYAELAAATWNHIETSAALQLVKSGDKLTKEQGVARFLQTDEGRELHRKYEAYARSERFIYQGLDENGQRRA